MGSCLSKIQDINLEEDIDSKNLEFISVEKPLEEIISSYSSISVSRSEYIEIFPIQRQYSLSRRLNKKKDLIEDFIDQVEKM